MRPVWGAKFCSCYLLRVFGSQDGPAGSAQLAAIWDFRLSPFFLTFDLPRQVYPSPALQEAVSPRLQFLLQAVANENILTVNGRARLVVQDAGRWQLILERLERAETITAICRGMSDADEGRVILLEDATQG